MGKVFSVENRTHCKLCGQPITSKRFRTFCSKKCRTLYFSRKNQANSAAWLRRKQDALASIPGKGKIQCKLCGRWYEQLCSHVVARHGLTGREYREAVGLDVKTGKSTLSARLHDLYGRQAIENGTYKNLKAGKKFLFKKGDKRAGHYKRSEETLNRLKNLHKLRYANAERNKTK
jgi:predicted nucleic acid-binding Zn ribbon protein